MQLTSPAFTNNQPIPDVYTMKGAGSSPSLAIAGVPAEAKSLALIMHDPDAPSGDFLHWTIWNIPPTLTTIDENTVPQGAVEGITDYGTSGYGQPAPPSGTHRYIFELYALDFEPSLPAGAARGDLEALLNGHVLAAARLVGTVSA